MANNTWIGVLYGIGAVEVEDESRVAVRYARRRNAANPYGFNVLENGWVGVWFPVGLFASNLKETEGALEFSAMPIGVAVGMRRWWSGYYLGFSAVANWSISSTSADSSEMEEERVTKVAGLGVGGLLDVNSYFYVGGMYVADFGGDDPGPMLTVGIGPGLIRLLTELRTVK